METWLSYRPGDFLLFSAETYWRLFELTNAATWPLVLLAPPLFLALVLVALTGRRVAIIAMALGVAAAWVITGEAFLVARYAPINWAAGALRPLFLAQAALFAVLASGLRFHARGVRLWAGGGLVALCLAYPLLGLAAGRPPAQSEVFAVAPDPTAIGTLGVLLLAAPSWRVALLCPLPLLWLAITTTTLHTMGAAGWFVPAVAAVIAVAALLVPAGVRRRDGGGARRRV